MNIRPYLADSQSSVETAQGNTPSDKLMLAFKATRNRWWAGVGAAAAVALIAPQGRTADKTWIGGSTSPLNFGPAWKPAGVPGPGDKAVFDTADTLDLAGTGWTVEKISIGNVFVEVVDSSTPPATLELGNGLDPAEINVSDGGSLGVKVDATFTGGLVVNGGGGSTGRVNFEGVVAGGTLAVQSGIVTLNGTNASLDTQIDGGKVVAGTIQALGTAPLRIGDGHLELGAAPSSLVDVTVSVGKTARITENSAPVSGQGQGVGTSTFGQLTFQNGAPLTPAVPNTNTTLGVDAGDRNTRSAKVEFTNVQLNGAVDTMDIGAKTTVVVTGGITDITGDSGTLVKKGAGTLELQPDLTGYKGGISVDAGQLVLADMAKMGTNGPVTTDATFKKGSSEITLTVIPTTPARVGDIVSGSGIRPGSRVVAINGAVLTLDAPTTAASGPAAGTTATVGILRPDVAIASGASLELKNLGGLAGLVGLAGSSVSVGSGSTGATITLNSIPVTPGTPEDYRLQTIFAGRDAVISVKPGSDVDVDLTTNPPAIPPLRNGATLLVDSLTIDGSVALNVENGSHSDTKVQFTGVVEGDGGRLVKRGNGLLVLDNPANSYSGGTVIEAGTVQMGDSNVFGSGPVTIAGGALDVNGNSYNAGKSFEIGAAGNIFDSAGGGAITVSGVIDAPVATGTSKIELALGGSAELVKSGAGELVLAGTQQYTGRTVINGGKLTLSGSLDAQGNPTKAADDTLVANSGIYVQGGVLDLGGSTQLEGTADVVFGGGVVDATIQNGKIQKTGGNFVAAVGTDRTVTVEASANLQSRTGSVVGLEKKGLGKLVLKGANGYNADTVIREGTVEVGDPGALGSGNIELGGGALSASGAVALGATQTIRVSANSNLSGGQGQLAVAGSTTIESNKTLTAGGGLILNGQVTGGGALVVDATNSTVTIQNSNPVRPNDYSGGTTVKSGTLLVGSDNALSSGGIVLDGGELSLAANQTGGAVTLKRGVVSSTGGKLASTAAGGVTASVAVGDDVALGDRSLSGDFTKDGGGTVTLVGTNALDAVTLKNGALAGNGKITSSAGITAAVAVGNAMAIGDNLEGSFIKDGEGTLELVETNLGFSEVTLKQGKVVGNGKLTSASGGVTADVAAGNRVTVAGNNLKGAFTKSGDGAVELSATNSELSDLTLAAGHLILGADQKPTGAVVLNQGAVSGAGKIESTTITANVGAGKNVTVQGNNLKGDLKKQGAGTISLNGGNTELRGIEVAGGVLEVGADQTSSGTVVFKNGTVSGPGKITATGAGGIVADVDGLSTVSVSAGLSSAAGLTKKDAGKLVLSGDNAGLNALTVEKGTVEIGQQKAMGSGLVTIRKTAKLDAGARDVSLPGANMVVDGEFSANSLTVGAGQVLSGQGSVQATVKLAGGAIAPGNSPGSITVAGLSGNGDYLWERNDSIALGAQLGSDLTNITVRPRAGTAVVPVTGLNSLAHDQVRADPSKSLAYGQIIKGTVPAAAGLPKFEGADTAVIKIRLVRNDNPGAPGIDLVVDRSSYANFARGNSGRAFGAYLDSQLSAHYDQPTEIGALLRGLDATASAADVSSYLRAIDPSAAYASLYNVGLRRAHSAAIPLEDRLDWIASVGTEDSAFQLAAAVGDASKAMIPVQPEGDANWTAWTSGQSSVLKTNAKSDFGTIKSTDNAASLGVEHQIGNLRIGGLASYGQGSATFGSPALQVESDYWHVGGYSSVAFGPVSVDASALFGSSDDSSNRPVAAGSARGNFGSNDMQLGMGVALNLIPKSSGWQVTPVARVRYVSYKQDGFAESGPGGSLLFRTNSVSEDTVLSRVGVRVAHSREISKSFKLGLDGAAYWVHDFNADGRNLALRLQGGNGVFQATGRNGQPDTAQLNLGLQATLGEAVTLRLSGQQEVGINRYQSTGVFTVGWNF